MFDEREGWRILPCKLTEAELAAKGQELAEAETRLQTVKDEKREAMAEFNTTIKSIEGEVSALARTLNRGYENREVEVITEETASGGVLETRRADTFEVIERRSLAGEQSYIS